MLPFSVDRLILDMQDNIENINRNIVENKFNFCLSFERELGLSPSEYSQMIFDYLFNLFYFKSALGQDFKKYLSEFKDLDFKNPFKISEYLNGGTNNDGSYRPGKYMEFVIRYKQYFMDYFGFNHDDSQYMERKFQKDRYGMVQKLMEYN